MKKQLITTHYLNKKTADSSDGFDKIIVITKDENGDKHHKIIEKPEFSYYITKPEFYEKDQSKYSYISRENVIMKTCYYKDLFKSMIKNVNDKKLTARYNAILKDGGTNFYRLMKEFHLDYRFHGTDMDLQDFVIHNFLNSYNSEENFISLTKAYFDIEVDSSKIKGFPKPEYAEAPINILTLVNQETMQCFVLMLKYDFDGYKKVVKNLDSIKNKLKEKYKDKKILEDVDFIFEQFDDELDLIKRFFYLINEELRPDFCVAWNISFDLVTIYNRIINLGGDVNEIMCPKDFKYKNAYYTLDTKHSDPAERTDSYHIVGYTIYLDLMCLYANITKPLGKKESYSLDAIAEEECGVHKDEYEGSIKTLHFDDYETFLFYNIQDSILLMLIEDKTKHLDLLYNISMLTHTRIEKSLKKTVCLRNYASQFYEREGYVISNNRSQLFERPEEKIKGAFVADPNNMANNGKKMLFQQSNKIYDLATDMDFASLYPSIIEALNIAPEAIDLKLFFYIRNKETGEFEESTDTFMDDFLSKDSINFCVKYYKTPSFIEMIDLVKENFNVN